MISTTKLLNISVTSLSFFFFFLVARTLRIYFLSNYNTLLLTMITMLCIRSPRTYSSYNWKFVPFDQHLFLHSVSLADLCPIRSSERLFHLLPLHALALSLFCSIAYIITWHFIIYKYVCIECMIAYCLYTSPSKWINSEGRFFPSCSPLRANTGTQ